MPITWWSVRWWRMFKKRLSAGAEADASVGPRRRQSTRYSMRTKLEAKCSSWPKFVELFTGDVSQTGLFIESSVPAQVGEELHLTLTLPNDAPLDLTGVVVRVITAKQATQLKLKAGLGVQISPPAGEADRRAFDALLESAKQSIPRPAQTVAGEPAPPAIKDAHVSEDSELLVLDGDSELLTLQDEPQAPPVSHEPPPKRALSWPKPGIIIGIDLGTTYTSVAAARGTTVKILARKDGLNSSPSVISFPDERTHLVGEAARQRIFADPGHTVVSPKRLLGRQYEDTEIQAFIGQAPYKTVAGPDGTTVIEMWGNQYAIPQLCGMLLNEVRELAESHLGDRIEQAVISVPISFDGARLEALHKAAQMARIELVSVIDEPSAAALANRFDANFGGVVGVYDFGGGTFDFSIVDVSNGDFKVLATAGDTWLGGDDFDHALATAAAGQFWRKYQVDLHKQALEWQRLVFACERAKRALSERDTAAIFVPEVLRTADGMIDLNFSIDRKTLASATKPIVDRSLATCNEALALLGMTPKDLSTVYLSGGTTYIPTVRIALARHFPVPIRTGVPPEHAVCLGAAIHAAQIQFHMEQTLTSRT